MPKNNANTVANFFQFLKSILRIRFIKPSYFLNAYFILYDIPRRINDLTPWEKYNEFLYVFVIKKSI